jgi:hypothetical protein
MTRQARLDAAGTLHHVMIRGIERSQVLIFNYVPHPMDDQLQFEEEKLIWINMNSSTK